MSLRRIVAVLAAAAAAGAVTMAAPAAQRPAPGDPAVFMKRVVSQIVGDDYARAWLTLHPVHRAVAPRWTYVVCELLSPVAGEIVSLEIVRVADRRIQVAGAGRLPAKGVTFRLVLNEPALDETVEVWHTSHLVAVRGRWRWILTPERYEYYLVGGCAPGLP